VIHQIKYTSGFSGSLILIMLFSLTAFCQEEKSAPGKNLVADSAFHTAFVSVGVDVSRLLFNFLSTSYKGGEASLDVRRKGLMGDFHFGFGQHSKSLERYSAKSSGIYCGFGISKSLFKEEGNMLAFGLRLAGSSFQYQPQNIQVPVFPTGYELVNPAAGSCFAMWSEVNAVVRTRLTGWIMMGFELRMKAILFTKTEGFTPYFIPGYGMRENTFSPGINYFMFVQISNGIKRDGKTH